jgi:hypothetical protein
MAYSKAISITPNNTTDLTKTVKALYVGVTGNVAVVMAGEAANAATLLVAVPAGTHLKDINISRIHATGTTANGLVGFY